MTGEEGHRVCHCFLPEATPHIGSPGVTDVAFRKRTRGMNETEHEQQHQKDQRAVTPPGKSLNNQSLPPEQFERYSNQNWENQTSPGARTKLQPITK